MENHQQQQKDCLFVGRKLLDGRKELSTLAYNKADTTAAGTSITATRADFVLPSFARPVLYR